MVTKEQIMERIAPIQDPEIGLGIVDLGLIYDVVLIGSNSVLVRMTLTTPACPFGPIIISNIEKMVKEIEGITRVEVELVWDPPWDPAEMASDYAKDVLGIW